MTLEEIITIRRSVRSFTDEPVSKETILKLLDMARWAPWACRECWRFVVVQEPERKQRLAQAAARQSWIVTAPVIIVVGADTDSLKNMGERWRGLFYIQDTAAAVQNLMLAAVEQGLGTCWIGSFSEEEVAQVVGFPAGVRTLAIVPVGHPKTPQKKSVRRPLNELVFWEIYGD